MAEGKNYTGTMNNPEISLEEFMVVLKSIPKCIAARCQLEKGEAGTPHFQWMISLSSKLRLNSIIKKLKGCHVEIAKNAMAAWNYCGKEDTRLEGPLEHGVPPAAKNVKGDTKKRNQMILEYGVLKAVEEGLIPIEKFKQTEQSVRLFQIMKKEQKSVDELLGEWHYGETGTGKSRSVREKYPDAFIKSNDVWWDGYNGEETVIIEEMGPRQIGGQHMKQWADHYPFKAACKGSQMLIRPKRIVVTSNYSIEGCYENREDHLPLKRRFREINYDVIN